MKILQLLCVFLVCFLSLPLAYAEAVLSVSEKYTIEALRIEVAQDQKNKPVELEAVLRKPVEKGVLFPTVVFITSWASPVFEYDAIASVLADKGYAVLTYVPRGFWGSDGELGTASPADLDDGNAIIDWLIQQQISNPDAIGISGVSYGAGIGYLLAAQNPKVRALVALSGWGDLIESLAPNLTPRIDWMTFLNLSGYVTSSRDLIASLIFRFNPDEIQQNFDKLTGLQNINEVIEWAGVRSPQQYWQNQQNFSHQPAVYSVNNLQDYMFQPDSAINLLKAHTGPWRLDLNFGTHAIEAVSQFIPGDYTWGNTIAWFDHYLKGEVNYIQCLKPINWTVHDRIAKTGIRESQNVFEDSDVDLQTTYFLNAGESNNEGLLTSQMMTEDTILSFDTQQTVITSGGLLDQLFGHRLWDIGQVANGNSLMFRSAPLVNNIYMRGSAKISFYSQLSYSSQFFVYLLAVDPETQETQWISHAPYSAIPIDGSKHVAPGIAKVSFDLYWTASDIAAGKELVVIIDGKDPDYFRFSETPNMNNVVMGKNYPASVTLPSVSQTNDVFTMQDLTPADKANCAEDNPADLRLGSQPLSVKATNVSPSVFKNGGGASKGLWLLLLVICLSIKRREFS